VKLTKEVDQLKLELLEKQDKLSNLESQLTRERNEKIHMVEKLSEVT